MNTIFTCFISMSIIFTWFIETRIIFTWFINMSTIFTYFIEMSMIFTWFIEMSIIFSKIRQYEAHTVENNTNDAVFFQNHYFWSWFCPKWHILKQKMEGKNTCEADFVLYFSDEAENGQKRICATYLVAIACFWSWFFPKWHNMKLFYSQNVKMSAF